MCFFQELVWFLCAISLSTSAKIHSGDDADSYAYSTVDRSFDKSHYEGAQTVSLPFEGVDKPRPARGAPAMTTTTAASTTPVYNWTTICMYCQAATTSVPTTPPVNVSTTAAPVTTPVNNMTQTSPPPVTQPPMPVTQPGKHLTPGWPWYGSSKEDHGYDHEAPYGSYESEDSHETFEGFSSW